VRIRVKLKRPLILAGAVSLPLVFGVYSPNLIQELRSWATTMTGPMLEVQDRTTSFFKKQITSLVEWPLLRKRNELLEAQVEQLSQELTAYDALQEEMTRLESLLELKDTLKPKTVAGRIIARDPSHWYHYVVLDKGTKDNVSENSVLVHAKGLVGKVVSAGPATARAILLIDRQSRVSARNIRTRDVGLVEGVGNEFLKMTYLDRGAKIEVGDTIASSGLGGVYPKDIPIGVVQMIGKEEDKLGLYAVIKPFAPFFKLEEVLCVSSQDDN
jgi:rod shape-determining protein MreC